MAHVVTGACSGCKHTLCVAVCPVDCFFEGADMLYIDPDLCTDCDLCVHECPVDAIYPEAEVPDDQRTYIALNAEQAPKCPNITETRPPGSSSR